MKNSGSKLWVWDVPIRLFHWMIVVLLAFSWWSAENGEMQWHYYSGLTICGLLIFRLLWGIIGTSTARFTQFIKGPGHVLAYVRGTGRTGASAGHNPLGSWSVIALLLALSLQVGTGLFSVDVDGLESGPLSYMVDFEQGRSMAKLHEAAFNALLILVALHVAAILFYLVFRRTNLITAMITGMQTSSLDRGATRVSAWRLIPAIAVAGALAWWISTGLAT